MLTVEDGTGKSDADSYLSVIDATERLTKLGYTAFAALPSDTVREASLRQATIQVDEAFYSNNRGEALREDQALAFPRANVYLKNGYSEPNEVPEEVLRLCALGAERDARDVSATGLDALPDNVKRIRLASRAEVEFSGGSAKTRAGQRLDRAYEKAVSFVAYGSLPPNALLGI